MKTAYMLLVAKGKWVTASEFWNLTPVEVWWLIEANKVEKMYGQLTETEADEILRDIKNGRL